MDDRPLGDLKEFSTTMANDINDLPAPARTEVTSGTMNKFLDLQLIGTRQMAQQRHTVTHVAPSHATDWIIATASVGHYDRIAAADRI
jgi:hypothetical protein